MCLIEFDLFIPSHLNLWAVEVVNLYWLFFFQYSYKFRELLRETKNQFESQIAIQIKKNFIIIYYYYFFDQLSLFIIKHQK